jgi:hypothetical protein
VDYTSGCAAAPFALLLSSCMCFLSPLASFLNFELTMPNLLKQGLLRCACFKFYSVFFHRGFLSWN